MIGVELDDRVLRGAAFAVRAADRDVRRAIGAAGQAAARPAWRAAVAARTRGRQDAAVYRGPNVSRGNPPELVAGQSTRALSGGLRPADDWRWVEFGSNRAHGRTGRLPRHTPGGRVAFPAVADVAPVVVSAWLAAIVDAYADPVGAE